MIKRDEINMSIFFSFWLKKLSEVINKKEISLNDPVILIVMLLRGNDSEALEALHILRNMFEDELNLHNDELNYQGYDNDQITWN